MTDEVFVIDFDVVVLQDELEDVLLQEDCDGDGVGVGVGIGVAVADVVVEVLICSL